ncbi:cytochrome P450 [Absidia repens]|uniref:Cytochrome P450 n=1 Tax=Absidia repens TaxID=90262 RepID=A0A1X2IEB6_9FUNG|nr:cytochrome P450 [Absidia repens]
MLETIADRLLKNKNFNDQYVLVGAATTAIAIGAVYIMRRQRAATKSSFIRQGCYCCWRWSCRRSIYSPTNELQYQPKKKFDALHFFLIYPYTISKTAVQDSIIKELNPRLKHYSPRAYTEFKNVMTEMLGESEEPAHLPTLAPVILRCISQACLAVFLGPDACKSTDLASTFSEMLHALSGEFELNLWHQVFPWYHQKYMEIYYPIMKKMKKHRGTIKSVIEKELDRRLSQNLKSDDLLQYIIESDPLEKNHETIESLTTYIVIMFFVGVLTTFGSTIGIIKLITEDESMMKDLKEEQEQAIDDEMLAQNITDVTTIDRDEFLAKNIAHIYRRMAKLDSFIREFFRYGTRNVAHAHTNVGDEDIILKSGAIIHPGDEVYINLWDVHQQSKKQNIDDDKSMDEFHAFRHVGQETPSTKVGGDYLLFGMGKKACPGRWFAIHQIKGIVTCLIRNYEMAVVEPGKIEYKKSL